MTPLAIGVMLTFVAPSVKPGAQSFSSGSDGSDGALVIAPNAGTIIFDPMETARWGKVLDPDGDAVYNFTTITIGSGSTLKLQGDKINRPVFWLATGDIVVNGTLDVSGAAGAFTTDLSIRRQLSVPGPGGYAGGAGGNSSCSIPATAGDGPGGGVAGGPCGSVRNAGAGTFAGSNRYLVPIVGGSGGGGALNNNNFYEGGGAGGGALLLASSTSIAVSGLINARGGNGVVESAACSGNGSGGAIRLVAPTLLGGGRLDVRGGNSGNVCSGPENPGFVRLEGFVISTSLNFDAGGAFVTRGSPVDPQTLKPASSIRVVAIDGVPVPASSSGSFVLPDVTISKNGSVNIDIQATGIPPGTIVTLQVYPQTPTDIQIVSLPMAQATLVGTIESSTATTTFTFPYGFSRGFVRATWTQ